MENTIMAYCGITCSDCDAYKATLAGDHPELERIAKLWNEEYKANFTAETLQCIGCSATEEPLCSHCHECELRACAIDRGVASCAYCDDYGCAIIERHLGYAASLRPVLDAMRATYLGTTGD